MKKNYKNPNIINIIVGITFTVLFVLTCKLYLNKWTGNRAILIQAITIAEIFIALINFMPKKSQKSNTKSETKKYNKNSIFAMIFVLIAVPLTVLAGHFVLGGKRYNLISTLIVLELLIPFIYSFEKKKPSVREIVIIAVICALAVAGRLVFYSIPQFKPITAIVIITGICLGAEKGFLTGAISAFVSNIFFGQGPWTHWQMLGLGMVGFIAGILFTKGLISKNKFTICIFGSVLTVFVYGGIVNFQSLLYYPQITWGTVISTYSMGLPYDIIHAVSTFFFLWFITEPFMEKLERIKSKYNILK